MIKFDLESMTSVSSSLEEARSSLRGLLQISSATRNFTTAPSLSQAFMQHQSFYIGQSGSAANVIRFLNSDIRWLQEVFENHVRAFGLQDRLAAGSFDQMNSSASYSRDMVRIRQANRQFNNIDNLIYTSPVTVAEAGTPLAALIAMFEGDDGAPLQAAKEWSKAGEKLVNSMAALGRASSGLAASAEGYSFDAARSAIDSVVSTGTTVGANAKLMGASMLEFPSVRHANLNALRAIQASTATITDPAAKLAAEQSAVVTFVSTQLQPSLELLRPPVANFGQPVVGHMGGGMLEASTTSQNSTATAFHTPQGGNLQVSQSQAGNLGGQAQTAADAAPNPTGTVNPASAPSAVAPNAPTTAPATNPATLTTMPAGASTPTLETTGASRFNPTQTATSPSNATAVSAPHGATASPRVAQGGPATGGRSAAGMTGIGHPRAGGPIVPQLPGRAAASAPVSIGNPGTTSGIGAGKGAHPGAGKGSHLGVGKGAHPVAGKGSQAVFGKPVGAPSSAQSHGAMAGGAGARGVLFGMGGHGATGRGAAGKKGAKAWGGTTARNAKAAAGIFGKGQWAPEVSEYFKRQFLGSKAKTVKKVIR